METLSKLLCSARNIETEKGDLSGQCVFCGFDTTEGHEAKLKDTFTFFNIYIPKSIYVMGTYTILY